MEVFQFFFSSLIGIILFVISLAVYFLPTIVAVVRKKRNALAIFLLNFFLGWTFIGWVVALVWAATKD
ncbi:MAG: superinfection immunity protein [Dehalococcoidales bacterium]|nr:superinfection immunity protein [Dehalococcoidales bacterium]